MDRRTLLIDVVAVRHRDRASVRDNNLAKSTHTIDILCSWEWEVLAELPLIMHAPCVCQYVKRPYLDLIYPERTQDKVRHAVRWLGQVHVGILER